eukprot:RCo045092
MGRELLMVSPHHVWARRRLCLGAVGATLLVACVLVGTEMALSLPSSLVVVLPVSQRASTRPAESELWSDLGENLLDANHSVRMVEADPGPSVWEGSAEPLREVAVCVLAHRATQESVANVISNVVAILSADFFVYHGSTPGPGGTLSATLRSVLSKAATVLRTEPQLTPQQFTAKLQRSPSAAQFRWLSGNALSPAFGARGGALFTYFAQSQCLKMIRAHELSTARRGQKYVWVVWSRLDMVWLHPHPPVGVLDPRKVWIPSGQDYFGGLNDRHAVCSRTAAEVYFRRWESLLSGAAAPSLCVAQSNSERFLRFHLHFAGLPVARFPAVAFLLCCGAGAGARDPSVCYVTECHDISKWGRVEPWVPRLAHGAKYVGEAEHAFENAAAVRERGGQWCAGSPARMPISHRPDPAAWMWNLVPAWYEYVGPVGWWRFLCPAEMVGVHQAVYQEVVHGHGYDHSCVVHGTG